MEKENERIERRGGKAERERCMRIEEEKEEGGKGKERKGGGIIGIRQSTRWRRRVQSTSAERGTEEIEGRGTEYIGSGASVTYYQR